jgi:hypothetical protein
VSTESSLGARTIIIHQTAQGSCFNITVGDRHQWQLASDEALWVIAHLLMGNEPPYRFQTIDEIREESAVRAKREVERNLRPFERVLEDSK